MPSSQAFQWRYMSWSAMCAFTLLSLLALSFSALQLSEAHSGKTRVVKAMRSPVGAHTGPLAPACTVVSWWRLPPSASAIQSWSSATYATRCPSGAHTASVADTPAPGNGLGVPPADGMV